MSAAPERQSMSLDEEHRARDRIGIERERQRGQAMSVEDLTTEARALVHRIRIEDTNAASHGRLLVQAVENLAAAIEHLASASRAVGGDEPASPPADENAGLAL